MQTREPARDLRSRNCQRFRDLGRSSIDLGGDSVYDTGHEIFHRDAGAGIACASCHAEGGDDGHVWHSAGVGARRTQSLNVGLEGTAPFHWSGDQADVPALMEEVFVVRMGGVHASPERIDALENWLYELQPLPPHARADDEAALRGKALFEGEAECSSCHSGSKFTNNKTVDVGTGEPLQVPSLVGVGYRAPLIHTGCAATLRDRFDPPCGGDKHGKTAQLAPRADRRPGRVPGDAVKRLPAGGRARSSSSGIVHRSACVAAWLVVLKARPGSPETRPAARYARAGVHAPLCLTSRRAGGDAARAKAPGANNRSMPGRSSTWSIRGPPECRRHARVVLAARAPVPISGGTLIVTPDGKYAVAADPDRDRVSVVDIAGLEPAAHDRAERGRRARAFGRGRRAASTSRCAAPAAWPASISRPAK